MSTYCISTYRVDRRYGGPEEGGWYYDAGEPVSLVELGEWGEEFLPRFTTNLEFALDCRERLNALLDSRFNKHLRPKSSVLSTGVYEAVIDDDSYPTAYPTERPRYE